MPNLETLTIPFLSALWPRPDHDVGRLAVNMPNVTHVILPNLRWLVFRGGSTYMETLLPRMSTLR
jgi:hypothetical protein